MKADTLKEAATPPNADTSTNKSTGGSAESPKKTDSPRKDKVKRRKKKGPKDGPKHPLTGYIRYMNVRREELRIIHPNATAIELTKLIGEEWTKLSDDKKQPFLAAAEIDRERFNQEVSLYKKMKKEESPAEDALKKMIPIAETNGSLPKVEKPIASNVSTNTAAKEMSATEPINNLASAPMQVPIVNKTLAQQRSGDYDIPIFTEEFLDHNKTVESELRMLRKSNTDYEQQNSVLEKHVENMKNGIKKLQDEKIALQSSNDILQTYLDRLREKLCGSLSALAIPTESQGATVKNIDKYMADLQQMANSNSHGPASLNKAKDIIRKLDLHIQL